MSSARASVPEPADVTGLDQLLASGGASNLCYTLNNPDPAAIL